MDERTISGELWALWDDLRPYVVTLFGAALSAAILWLRSRLQVHAAESAALETELEAGAQERAGGERIPGEEKKRRAMERAATKLPRVARPTLARLDTLVERAVPAAKRASSPPPPRSE